MFSFQNESPGYTACSKRIFTSLGFHLIQLPHLGMSDYFSPTLRVLYFLYMLYIASSPGNQENVDNKDMFIL